MTRRSSTGIGFALLAIGLAALLGRLGLWKLAELWRAWPLILVGMGVLQLWERKRANASGLGIPERFLAIAVTAVGFALSFGFVIPGRRANGIERPSRPTHVAEIKFETRATRDFTCPERIPVRLAVVAVTVEIRRTGVERCRAAIATAADGVEVPSLEISAGADALLIAVNNPRDGLVRLTIEVPEGTEIGGSLEDGELDVEGSGTVAVQAVGSSLRLRDITDLLAQVSAGSVRAESIAGRVELEARSADVALAEVAGPVTIHGWSSRIRLTGSAAPVEMTVEGGAVAIAQAAATISLKSRRSDIDIVGVSGHVEVEGGDANVHLDAIQGGADVAMQGGWLTASDIQGDFALKSSPRRAKLSRIVGAVNIRTAGTRLSLQSCVGTIDLEQDGGSIRLNRNQGHARVRARDSELAVDLDDDGTIEAVTERANITLALASEHLGAVVTTTRGAIRVEPDTTESAAAEASSARELRLPGSPIAARIAATDGIVRVHR